MKDLMEYSKRMVGAVRERLGNHPAVKKDEGNIDGKDGLTRDGEVKG